MAKANTSDWERGWLTPCQAAYYVNTSQKRMYELMRDKKIASVPSLIAREEGIQKADWQRRVIAKADLDAYMRNED